jgi:hypothetical protein
MADIFELAEQASEALRAYAAHPDTPPVLSGTLDDLADILDRRRLEVEAGAAAEAAAYFRGADEKAMRSEWHRSETYRSARNSYREVPIWNPGKCGLADAGIDLDRAGRMTDDELLRISHMGPITLGKLRAHLAAQQPADELA